MRQDPKNPVGRLRHSYVSTNVTTSAWVELTASIPAAATAVEIFDSSGRVLQLAVAAAGSEAGNEIPYYIIPGGSTILLPLEVHKSRRMAIKAVDATADAGFIVLNFFG